MACPACGHSMTVVSCINPWQREVIQKILTHCGLHERPCRAPPPSTSPLQEVTYVSDLEYADAPPTEPVWSAQRSAVDLANVAATAFHHRSIVDNLQELKRQFQVGRGRREVSRENSRGAKP
jgi:hypothetical protein